MEANNTGALPAEQAPAGCEWLGWDQAVKIGHRQVSENHAQLLPGAQATSELLDTHHKHQRDLNESSGCLQQSL